MEAAAAHGFQGGDPRVLAELKEGKAVDVKEVGPRKQHQREAGAHKDQLHQNHRHAAPGKGETVEEGAVLRPLAPPDGESVEKGAHQKKLDQEVGEHHGEEGGQVLQQGRVPTQELHGHGEKVDDRDEP